MRLLNHLLLGACLLLARGEKLTFSSSPLSDTLEYESVSSTTAVGQGPASTRIKATGKPAAVSSPSKVSTAALAETANPYLSTTSVASNAALVPRMSSGSAGTTGSSTVTAEPPKNATASSASNNIYTSTSELTNTSVVTGNLPTGTVAAQHGTSAYKTVNNSYNISISTEKPFTLPNGTVVFTPVNTSTGSTKAGVGITTGAKSASVVTASTTSATTSLAAERINSEVHSPLTSATTVHLQIAEQKTLSSGSIAAVTVIVIVVVLLIFGGATYIKMSRSSYGRLLDDQDYGSWGNYNNPLYDDS